RLRVRIAAVLIGVVILSGCAGPTTNDDAMRSQAARSANSATSEIETLKLAVTTQLDGNGWWRFTDVVVTDSETALDSINSTLASRQPPSTKTEAIRADTVTALGDAVDLAIDVRIAVRRHDESTLESLLPKLTQMSDRLGALEARAR
ncbi:MAG TPA: hypothetical protein VH419_05295, partial [Nocardioidaceae bacterium]